MINTNQNCVNTTLRSLQTNNSDITDKSQESGLLSNKLLPQKYVRKVQNFSPLKFNQTDKFTHIKNKKMKTSQNTVVSVTQKFSCDSISLKKNSNSLNFNGIHEKANKNSGIKPRLDDLDIRSIESIEDEQSKFRQMEQSVIISEFRKQPTSKLEALYLNEKKQRELCKKFGGQLCHSRTNSTQSIGKSKGLYY